MVVIGNFFMIIRKIKSIMRVDWISTLYVNSKLPFKQGIKLPIWLYGSHIDSVNQKIIESGNIYCGMIRLGLRTSSLLDHKDSIHLNIQGILKFKGPGFIGNQSYIEISPSGYVELNENFGITGGIKISSRKSIIIGKRFSSSWDVSIIDTDFHTMVNILNSVENLPNKAILIENDVWICNKALVLKGSVLPPNTTVAAGAIINKDYSEWGGQNIIGGNPVRILKRNVIRKEALLYKDLKGFDIIKWLKFN